MACAGYKGTPCRIPLATVGELATAVYCPLHHRLIVDRVTLPALAPMIEELRQHVNPALFRAAQSARARNAPEQSLCSAWSRPSKAEPIGKKCNHFASFVNERGRFCTQHWRSLGNAATTLQTASNPSREVRMRRMMRTMLNDAAERSANSADPGPAEPSPAPETPRLPLLDECPICGELCGEGEEFYPAGRETVDDVSPAPGQETADGVSPAPGEETANGTTLTSQDVAERNPGEERLPRFVFQCGHNCCRPCAAAYVAAEVEGARLPLRCFDQGCRAEAGNALFRQFLSGDQLERVYQWEFERAIVGDARFVACPAPDCRSVVEIVGNHRVVTCPACALQICPRCRKPGHAGACAEDMPKDVEQYVGDSAAQRCPSCRMLVEKTEGCNDMKCRCGARFCYLCGETITSTKHFTQGHGQFQAPKKQPARPSAEPPRNSDASAQTPANTEASILGFVRQDGPAPNVTVTFVAARRTPARQDLAPPANARDLLTASYESAVAALRSPAFLEQARNVETLRLIINAQFDAKNPSLRLEDLV